MRAEMAAAEEGARPQVLVPPAPSRRLVGTGAVAALVLVALVWGGAFSLVKDTLATVAPASLVTWRFTVATVILLVVRPAAVAGLNLRILVQGLVLGTVLGVGFLLHTWGMQTTSVVVSAFITGTAVVFAPLVAFVWTGRRLGARRLVAIGLAVAGLAVITLRGAHFGAGELLITAAAALWGAHLVLLEAWTRPGETYQTALVQMAAVAALAALVQVATPGRLLLPSAPSAGLSLLMLGALATAGAFVLLTWAQTRTDATTAAVVLTLEPVFGAATAIVLGESVSLPVGLGAAAVIAAAFMITRPDRAVEPITARGAQ